MTFLFAHQNLECGLILPRSRPAFSVTGIMFRIQFILHQANIIKVTAGSDTGVGEQKNKGKNPQTSHSPPHPLALSWDRTVFCTPFSLFGCSAGGGSEHRYSDLLLLLNNLGEPP